MKVLQQSSFWYRTRSQIRTKASGFQFCKGNGFRTVFIVAGKHQMIVIQINSIDKAVNQPTAMLHLARIP